jgi:hypothetical protein
MKTRSAPTDIQISVKDMPDVDRRAKCALPIIVSALDHPEYPGIHGTCIAVRHGAQTAFLTAAHVVRVTDGTRIQIPLGFGASRSLCEIREVVFPVPSVERYESACDVAAMLPVSQPLFIDGQTEPIDLLKVARVEAARPNSLFAIAGYPRSLPANNLIDYDLRTVSFSLYHGLGTYAGPFQFDGCHTLDVSTVEVGGPQGLSGSPVFRCLLNDDGSWSAAFAGMVIMGSPSKIHFVDVAWLARFLLRDVFHDTSITLE